MLSGTPFVPAVIKVISLGVPLAIPENTFITVLNFECITPNNSSELLKLGSTSFNNLCHTLICNAEIFNAQHSLLIYALAAQP